MTTLFFGIDVSKGYADFCCINQAGSRIGEISRFDDTPGGHKAVKRLVESLKAKYSDAELVFGLENSGGLERNWAVFLKKLVTPFNGKVFTLNPLAVKKFLDRDLHRNITDAVSAQGIANYLRQGMRPAEIPFEDSLSGPISLYRCLRNAISRCAQMQNELQSLLPRVQPEFVQFCRQGLADWTLEVLQRWPTAPKLAKAKMAQLVKIPHVTAKRAESLIAAAKESVASQGDSFTEISVSFLAKGIIQAQEMIATLKEQAIESVADDEGVKIMQTIPGIGAWGATCLRLEIGSIERFPSPEALVAFAGLDPRIKQSGDSTRHIGISRRGRRQIRAILYPLVLVATRHNPVIREFYARLRAKGKGHLVSATACMRKMLHIAYGCWISGKPFDPCYEKNRQVEKPQETPSQGEKPASKTYVLKVEAPVSRREAGKRRKAVTLPQTGISRRERGPGTASVKNVT
ncbi:MAG: transposase IS116/IS110/IS902 [uncultured bacterium]|nr:MAG: transposase IS116/IS110/IS902 [uncultured bacterium]